MYLASNSSVGVGYSALGVTHQSSLVPCIQCLPVTVGSTNHTSCLAQHPSMFTSLLPKIIALSHTIILEAIKHAARCQAIPLLTFINYSFEPIVISAIKAYSICICLQGPL